MKLFFLKLISKNITNHTQSYIKQKVTNNNNAKDNISQMVIAPNNIKKAYEVIRGLFVLEERFSYKNYLVFYFLHFVFYSHSNNSRFGTNKSFRFHFHIKYNFSLSNIFCHGCNCYLFAHRQRLFKIDF